MLKGLKCSDLNTPEVSLKGEMSVDLCPGNGCVYGSAHAGQFFLAALLLLSVCIENVLQQIHIQVQF